MTDQPKHISPIHAPSDNAWSTSAPQQIALARRDIPTEEPSSKDRKPTKRNKRKPLHIVLAIVTVLLVAEIGVGGYFLLSPMISGNNGEGLNTSDVKAQDNWRPQILPTEIPDAQYDIVALGFGDEDAELLAKLENLCDNYPTTISLAVYSADGTKAIAYNTTKRYFSACTVKTGFILYACQQIDAGNGSFDDTLVYTSADHYGGSGKIQYEGVGSSYKMSYLLNQALSISDNVAYNMVRHHFGMDGYNTWITNLGAPSLTLDSMYTHNALAKDYIVVWDAVKKYFDTNTEGARILKEACTNTDFDYATENLHQYDYSHKSGDSWNNPSFHDTGIVWCEHPYIFAALTTTDADGDSGYLPTLFETVTELFNK